MKPFVFVAVVASLTLGSQAMGQSNNTSSSIVGSWQLVSGTYTTDGNTTKRDSSNFAAYKVITPHWYMLAIYGKQDGILLGSNSGILTYNGKQMTHTAKYANNKERIGITATFDVDVKGNILHQKGRLMNIDLEEEWIRIN